MRSKKVKNLKMADNDPNNNHHQDNTIIVKRKMSKKLVAFICVLLVAIPIGSAAILNFWVMPMYHQKKANQEIQNVKDNTGDFKGLNTELQKTDLNKDLKNVNKDQKKLVAKDDKDNKDFDKAVFVFTNGKDNPDKKRIDLYIDFGSDKSRSLLLMDDAFFRGILHNGIADIYIHPVPSDDPSSLYIPEAIAESFAVDSSKSWDFMHTILKDAQASKNNDTLLTLMNRDAKALFKNSQIDKESIKNGTFASWIISAGSDDKLKTGFYPPIIYIDGTMIDSNKDNIFDFKVLKKYIFTD